MKRFVISLCLLCCCSLAVAEEDIRAVQARLKADGFYFGVEDGVYSSDTAAAVSRFQIRRGLPISGQLDAETSKALGLAAAPTATATPSKKGEVWRHLRKSDQQFLEKLNRGEIQPPPGVTTPPAAPLASSPLPDFIDQPAAAVPPPPAPAGEPARPYQTNASDPERLRDYVAAFVLAGLDPQVGSELEFFSERVSYYGNRVTRTRIRRDLERYNERWPLRRFWLAGDLQLKPAPDGGLRVTFPLRYELRGPSGKSAGEVMKTLVLRKDGEDFEIVGVSERKRN